MNKNKSALLTLVPAVLAVSCGGGGGSSQTAPTPMSPAATATLAVNYPSVAVGQWIVLSWSSKNATSCSAAGAWSGTQTTSGSQSFGPITHTSDYLLTCSGPGGASATQKVTVVASTSQQRLSIAQSWDDVSDVAWDSRRSVMYVATGSNALVSPNSVLVFDPIKGQIDATIFAGSEPSALAISSDGNYLYVGFAGSDTISRYLLPALTLDVTFSVDSEIRTLHGDPSFASQIAAGPQAPLTIAVATQTDRLVPPMSLFHIFDDQTARAFLDSVTPPRAWSLAWGADDNTLYGGELGGTIDVFNAVPPIIDRATAVPLVNPGPLGSGVISTVYSSDSLYNAYGDVFSASTLLHTGTLPASGMVVIDAANNTGYVASTNDTLTSFNLATLAPLETLSRSFGFPQRLIRWGVDGLAILSGGLLTIGSGPFVASGGAVTPVGTIPGTASVPYNFPQFNPNVLATGIVPIDIAWDAHHAMLFAAIPSTDPDHPNTIAIVDTVTGAATQYVPTASAPGALAVSDDGQYLYVGESGQFQRFLLPSMTLDIAASYQFASGTTPTTEPPVEIAVAPGAPHTIAVVFDYETYAEYVVFDDATERQVPVYPNVVANWLQWSADGSTLYGLVSGNTGMLAWSANPADTAHATLLGPPFSYPWNINPDDGTSGYPFGMVFTQVNGLLYGGTGAIFDPVSGGWPGTFPLRKIIGAANALGVLAIDSNRARVYALVCADFDANPCFNYLMEFDLTHYVALAVGTLQDQGTPYRLEEISPTLFAALTSDGLMLVSSSTYGQ